MNPAEEAVALFILSITMKLIEAGILGAGYDQLDLPEAVVQVEEQLVTELAELPSDLLQHSVDFFASAAHALQSALEKKGT